MTRPAPSANTQRAKLAATAADRVPAPSKPAPRDAVFPTLQLVCHPSLPRLAWCAELRASSPRVIVHHGPDVETWTNGFFEGAWDGPFSERGFDDAITMTGTGARVTDDGLVFVTPSNIIDRLYSLRRADRLWISNSFVFLLVSSGARPDPSYPYYWHDLVDHLRWGIAKDPKYLRTESGNPVRVHDWCNFLVRPDLSLTRIEKRQPASPTDFTSYVSLLEESMQAVFENATDPARKTGFRPLATVSRGYDSTAISVLAARLGCREAIALIDDAIDSPGRNDDGLELAARLGMKATPYSLVAFQKLPGLPEAEFCVYPDGSDAVMAAARDQLAGSLLLIGRHGDVVWSMDERKAAPQLMEPGLEVVTGATMNEFRLDTGFQQLVVPYIGATHCRTLNRISHSPELAAWSVGGDYDRPIPRRIAEEAGIPRAAFGQVKMATAHFDLRDPRRLSPASAASYATYCARHARPMSMSRRLAFTLLRQLYRLEVRLRLAAMAFGLGRFLPRLHWVPGRYRPWDPFASHLLQWGFEHVRGRYALADPLARCRGADGIARGNRAEIVPTHQLRP